MTTRPGLEPHLERDVHAARGAALLVAVRRVHLHRQVELLRERELGAVVLVLGLGLVVVADLADGHHAFLGEEQRQHVEHLLGERLVVGLLAVEADGAVVLYAELRGAEALPADQARQVIHVGADAGTRLT
jgi:hypothetical protein